MEMSWGAVASILRGEVQAEGEVCGVCFGQVRNSPWSGWSGQGSEGREAGRWMGLWGPGGALVGPWVVVGARPPTVVDGPDGRRAQGLPRRAGR